MKKANQQGISLFTGGKSSITILTGEKQSTWDEKENLPYPFVEQKLKTFTFVESQRLSNDITK